jgi:signal transduction histidine kinase
MFSLYARPPVVVDINAPTPTEQVLAATRAANDEADRVARELRLQSVVAFGVLLASASGVCWYASGRALRPLREVTATAGKLSQDTLTERIGFDGPRDELWALAHAFDAMVDRLERAFDAQRLFVASASHELRTPLTVIRTASEIALDRSSRSEAEYRRALSTINRAAQRSERLLDSLLRLARTQHQSRGDERVDLAGRVRATMGPDLGHTVAVREDLAPAMVTGDPHLLDLLVRNLVDNAVRYNADPGWVAVRTGTRDGRAFLEVENTGPALEVEQLATLLRPFQRGSQIRSATMEEPTRPSERRRRDNFGLGLAIVDAVVHAHGAYLGLVARAGGGLLVTVVF